MESWFTSFVLRSYFKSRSTDRHSCRIQRPWHLARRSPWPCFARHAWRIVINALYCIKSARAGQTRCRSTCGWRQFSKETRHPLLHLVCQECGLRLVCHEKGRRESGPGRGSYRCHAPGHVAFSSPNPDMRKQRGAAFRGVPHYH